MLAFQRKNPGHLITDAGDPACLSLQGLAVIAAQRLANKIHSVWHGILYGILYGDENAIQMQHVQCMDIPLDTAPVSYEG